MQTEHITAFTFIAEDTYTKQAVVDNQEIIIKIMDTFDKVWTIPFGNVLGSN